MVHSGERWNIICRGSKQDGLPSGVFAEFESGIIREKVNAGLARARANGVKLGRRRVRPFVAGNPKSMARYHKTLPHQEVSASAPRASLVVILMTPITVLWAGVLSSSITGRPFGQVVILNADSVSKTVGIGLGTAIWMIYVLRSKRVKNTFVK